MNADSLVELSPLSLFSPRDNGPNRSCTADRMERVVGSTRHIAIAIFSSTVLFGCNSGVTETGLSGSGGDDINHPPKIQAAHLPEPITRSGPVTVSLSVDDPEHGAVTFQYRWYVNENLIEGETGPQFPPEKLKRGDRVSVEITPSNGRSTGAPYKTQSVLVGNTLPFVARIGLPEQIKPGDTVKVETEIKDEDNDEVHVLYRWWKNQDVVVETEVPSLVTTGFVRGDVLGVTVIPRDAGGEGKQISPPPVVVGNSPPRFTSRPLPVAQRGVYEYLLTAVDPEGDPISFDLQMAPPGMTIDKKAGLISWKIPADLSGAYRVRVVAEDGQGGSSSQEFELTVSAPSASS